MIWRGRVPNTLNVCCLVNVPHFLSKFIFVGFPPSALNEFQKITNEFIKVSEKFAKEVDTQKMMAIGVKNVLKTISKQRQTEQRDLQVGKIVNAISLFVIWKFLTSAFFRPKIQSFNFRNFSTQLCSKVDLELIGTTCPFSSKI